jgi:hypothetical protein
MRWLHKICSNSLPAGRPGQRASCRSHWRATCPLTQNAVISILS